MSSAPKVLAVITARKGSKRLVGKNLLAVNNKPLIFWTLLAAKESDVVTEALLSTDCPQMQALAIEQGIQAPFLRPNELAQDNSRSIDVVLHALRYYQQQGKSFDYVMLLQPTSPLRTGEHIDLAFQQMIAAKASGIISVCPAEHSPIWTGEIGADNDMSQFLDPKFNNFRSQDLPSYFRLNGAIYIGKVREVMKQQSFFLKSNLQAFKMTQQDSVDIDTQLDFKLAQLLFEEREKIK